MDVEKKALAGVSLIMKVVGEDGSVVEREVTRSGCILDPKDFDLTTMEGFRNDFDIYEKSMLALRDEAMDVITEAYLEEAKKKTRE